MIQNPVIAGKSLPDISNPGTAADLLTGKQLIGPNGEVISGSMPSVVQATPSITVSSGGLITAKADQSGGKVDAGSRSATHQLTTQGGKTVTPGTSQQTAVYSGRYTTGDVYVAGDPDLKPENIKSGVNIFGVAGTLSGKEVYIDEVWKSNKLGEQFGSPTVTASADIPADEVRLVIRLSKNIKELISVTGYYSDDKSNRMALIYPAPNTTFDDFTISPDNIMTVRAGKALGLVSITSGKISFIGNTITITHGILSYGPFDAGSAIWLSHLNFRYIPA